MPNHVTNILTITGKEDKVKEAFDGIRGEPYKDDYSGMTERYIDFTKIIPSPESINIESSSIVSEVAKLLKEGSEKEAKKYLVKQFPSNKKATSGVENKPIKNPRKHYLEMGYTFNDNIVKYGCSDWYSWNCRYWGTKWNAYETREMDENTIEFQTAWSMPEPIFVAISEKYPEVEVYAQWADEDFGSNTGSATWKEGEEISCNVPESGSVDAYRCACDVQGGGDLSYTFFHNLSNFITGRNDSDRKGYMSYAEYLLEFVELEDIFFEYVDEDSLDWAFRDYLFEAILKKDEKIEEVGYATLIPIIEKSLHQIVTIGKQYENKNTEAFLRFKADFMEIITNFCLREDKALAEKKATKESLKDKYIKP